MLFADEAGFCLLPQLSHTWAKKGKTPEVIQGLKYQHVSAISAITPEGKLFFASQHVAYKSEAVIDFLKAILKSIAGELILLWDNASIHRSKAIKAFLDTEEGKRLTLVFLPPYAPHENPDEKVWAWLKKKLSNSTFLDLEELQDGLHRQVGDLEERPLLIKAFFRSVDWNIST